MRVHAVSLDHQKLILFLFLQSLARWLLLHVVGPGWTAHAGNQSLVPYMCRAWTTVYNQPITSLMYPISASTSTFSGFLNKIIVLIE
jgi:hypothetical protein